MTALAARMQSFKPSATIAMSEKARALADAGKAVISLAAGELDFDTPAHIGEAAWSAIRRGETRYTSVGGTGALKRAIATKFEHENGLLYLPNEIMVATGAKQILFNAMLATLDPGDEVIIPAPCWASYPDIVAIAGGTPIIVQTSPETGFKLRPDALGKALGSRSKWLLLNSPSNPTGSIYSSEELEALAQILRGAPGVSVLCDDIYEHLRYIEGRHATMAGVAPDLRDRILTVNGVSKSHAMTGWRIGYAGGPQSLIAAMTALQSQSTSNPSSISQAGAVAALTGPQDFIDTAIDTLRSRRDRLVAGLNAIPGLACALPEGAFYAFVDCRDLLGSSTPNGMILADDMDVATYLLEEALVAVVPGSAFLTPGYLRLSFASSWADLEEALNRIRLHIGRLRR